MEARGHASGLVNPASELGSGLGYLMDVELDVQPKTPLQSSLA